MPAHPVLLQKAANRFIKYLFSAANKSASGAPAAGSGGGSGGDSRRGSSIGGRPSAGGGGGASSFQFMGVATQFKTSLKHLMETIGFDLRSSKLNTYFVSRITLTTRHTARNTTRHDTTHTERHSRIS